MPIPGEHMTLLGRYADALEARRIGWVLRDTFLLLESDKYSTVYLFRWPLEKTLVENASKYGTGGLWIDGCRIGTHTRTNSSAPRGPRLTMAKGMVTGMKTTLHNYGRWPPNLLLVHSSDCVRGENKVILAQSRPASGPTLTGVSTSNSRGVFKGTIATASPFQNGTETVENWSCTPDCVALSLDNQSGDRKSTGDHPSTAKAQSNYRPGQGQYQTQGPIYSDSGGASRFFPQLTKNDVSSWFARLTRLPF